MKKGIIILSLLWVGISFGFSQEEEWEKQQHVTGYISLDGIYIKGLEIFERNYGIALSQAGLLYTYQPLQKLTFRSVFVYRPGLLFDQMLTEVNAELKIGKNSFIKAGRFLTPLSPVNLTQYAPMNTAASLPMLVTHHNMYPMNIDGISLNGTTGDNIKFNYNVFGGGYFDAGYLAFDPIGYTGKEIYYTEASEVGADVDFDIKSVDMALFGAVGGQLGISVNDMFDLGFNGFYGGTDMYVNPFDPESVAAADTTDIGKGTKHAFGLDAKLVLGPVTLSGEQWFGKLTAINEPSQDISGGFYEFKGTFGNFTPYFQYERHLMYDLHYTRIATGLNFKPSFETTLKLEYFYNGFDGNEELDKYSLNGAVISLVYSF